MSWPRNIKERSCSRSERARGGVEMKELREVDMSVSMNRQVWGRKNFMVDTIMNGQPVKLSENGLDVVSFYIL